MQVLSPSIVTVATCELAVTVQSPNHPKNVPDETVAVQAQVQPLPVHVGSGLNNYTLIKGAAVAFQTDGQSHDEKKRNWPEVRDNLFEGVAFEEYAPDDTEVMGKGEESAYLLGPDRHAAEGKHES